MDLEYMKHALDLFYMAKTPSAEDVRDNGLFAARMVMRQIFADPAFQKALQ
jgi:hypothetical protein